MVTYAFRTLADQRRIQRMQEKPGCTVKDIATEIGVAMSSICTELKEESLMKYIPHDSQQYTTDYIEIHPIVAVLFDMGLYTEFWILPRVFQVFTTQGYGTWTVLPLYSAF